MAGSDERGQADGGLGVASFKYPMDLALSADGSVWIADAGTHLVRRWAAGEVTTHPLAREIATPHGIAEGPGGTVYLAEMGTHRVAALDPEGALVTVCGTGEAGAGPGELDRPAAVLVHGGLLWIADLGNHRIVAVPLAGESDPSDVSDPSD